MRKTISNYLQNHKLLSGQNFFRLLFVALLIFEFLNMIGVLQLTLQFTWRGLFTTSIIAFAAVEVTAFFYFFKKKFLLHWLVWLLVFISIGLDLSADLFHLYARFDWWDQLLHAYSSASICFTIFIIISAFWLDRFRFFFLRGHARLHLALFLAATTTMTLAAVYEIEEYTEDLIFGTNRLGPGTDTANDLVMNALGIIVTIIILRLVLNKKPDPKILE